MVSQFNLRRKKIIGIVTDAICFASRNAWLQKRVPTEGALKTQFLNVVHNVVSIIIISIFIEKPKRRKTTMTTTNQQIRMFS